MTSGILMEDKSAADLHALRKTIDNFDLQEYLGGVEFLAHH